MSEKATVVVGGNIVPLGSDYAGTPTYRPTKVDANGIQHVALATDNTGLAKDGNDITGVTMPTGGSGIRGWLSAIFNTIGTGATGVTQRTGGSGLFGWLSSIYYTLTSQTTSMTDGTQKTQITTAPMPQAMTQTPSTNSLTLTAAATAVPLRVNTSADLANRKQLYFQNTGTGTAYWGGVNVSDTNGIPLAPGEFRVFDQNPGSVVPVYIYSPTGTTIAVAEVA